MSFSYGSGDSDINAWAASFYFWGVANGSWHSLSSGYSPQPGDVAVYGNLTEAPGPGHVGIYVTGKRSSPTVVNGNWATSWPTVTNYGVMIATNESNTEEAGGNLDGYVSPEPDSPSPSISSFTVTPSTLAFGGGSVALSANVANATTCTFSSTEDVPGLPSTIPCSNGGVVQDLAVPANTGKKVVKYAFDFSATGSTTTKAGPVELLVQPQDCRPRPHAYLVGCDFAGENLAHANLKDATLTIADFSHASLKDANLTGANLVEANLTEANLSSADFAGANLQSAALAGANVSGARFADAGLAAVTSGGIVGTPTSLPTDWIITVGYLVGETANLTDANMTNANLSEAILPFANLTGADLTNANLTDADLTSVTFTDANLTSAELTDGTLPFANLTDANLTDANLTDANLTTADLNGVTFTSAILTDTDLYGTTLNNADLAGAYLAGATLFYASSGGIIGTPASLPTNWILANGYLVGQDANLIGANLANVNLTDADLAGANLSGANLLGADLTDVTWSNTTCPDETNSDNNGNTCGNNL